MTTTHTSVTDAAEKLLAAISLEAQALTTEELESSILAKCDAVEELHKALAQSRQPSSEAVTCPIGLDVKGSSMFCSAGYCDTCKKRTVTAAIKAAHPQPAAPTGPTEPEWIDDPHDIEQGMIRNPKWKPALVAPTIDALVETAQKVIDRWNSPAWEWRKQGPTAELVQALEAAIRTFRTGVAPAAPVGGRGEVEAGRAWDHIDDVIKVVELMRAGKWGWGENTRCKYIQVRIDTRDGGCIIKDREGKRITPEQLAKQPFGIGGMPWEGEHATPAPTQADAKDAELTADEMQAVIDALEEAGHGDVDFETECLGCTAHQKISAAIAATTAKKGE